MSRITLVRRIGWAMVLLCAIARTAVAAPTEADWQRWRHLIDVQPAQVLQEAQSQDSADWPQAQRLQLTLLAARADLELGQIDDMRQRLSDVAAAVRASNDEALQAQWHAYQGCAFRALETFAEAHRQWERSLTLARKLGDAALQSFVLTQQADVYLSQHDLYSAAAVIEKNRLIAEASTDEQLKARHIYWAGILQMTVQNFPRSQTAFREAAQRFRSLDNPTWESDSQRLLANTLLDAGQADEALAPAQRAVALLEQIDDPVYLSLARGTLALALAFHGERARALSLSRLAVTSAARFSDGEWKRSMLLRHAEVLWRCGNPAEAIAVLRRDVWPILPSEHTLPSMHRRFQLLLAESLSAAGDATGARNAWREVLRLSLRNFDRMLADQLAAQRGELEMQRLQRENDLLQQRSQQAERALRAESHARSLITVIVVLLLGAAASVVWWLRRVNRRIAAVASLDSLTGLLNRRSALDMGGASLETARRLQQPLSVLLLDIDHFKRINDTHGHATGDAALRHVATLLRQCLRNSDQLARWGGEEFLVVLPNASREVARGLAERLRTAIESTAIDLPGGSTLHMSTSVGLASLGAGDSDLPALIARADRALYRAKREGRNRVFLDTSTVSRTATGSFLAAPPHASLPTSSPS